MASMAIDNTTADLGSMNVVDEKSATFTITNTSSSETLRIWNITTSCNCTFATITIDGTTTGEFSMHGAGSLKNWIGEILPGKQARLTAIYRPKIMPVTGSITRQINFSTNDPKNQDMQVSISANVQ